MSCDAAALALALHLADYDPAEGAPRLIRAVASAPAPVVNPLAREPLFSSIVRSAGRLRDAVDGVRRSGGAPSPDSLRTLDAQTAALAALDMQGHVVLAGRGTDGDLKCILRGISQDLPRKLAAVAAAADPAGRRSALDEFWYLLRDNVEVVTAPPVVESGVPTA